MKNNLNLDKARQQLVWEEYQKLINSNNNIIIEIEVVLEKLHMTLERFISLLMAYINENIKSQDYDLIFDELLKSEHPEEYLKERKIEPEILKNNLQNYLLNRRPDILFRNKKILTFLNKLLKYNEKIYQENLKKEKDKKEIMPIIEKNTQDFINTPYSIERFCLQRKLPQSLFNLKNGLYPRKLAIYNKNLYQDFFNNLYLKNKIKNDTIKNDILTILNLIKEKGKKFDSIDFYQATIYGPLELIEYSKSILNSSDFKLFHDTLCYYKNNNPSYVNNINRNQKNEIINSKFSLTINGTLYEANEEERKYIIDFLEAEFIPIDTITFIDAYRRYFKNNLESKKKVK